MLRTGLVDRLADWLLTHCPFTTVTTLGVVVAGSSIALPLRPAAVLVPVIVADLTLNLYRYVRDLRRGAAGSTKPRFHVGLPA